MPLRELLPVRAEHEPVVDHLGQLAAERARDALLHLEIRPVVRSANHVRDPEVEVVDDGRELVRGACRRARRSVVPSRASRTEPSSSRSAPPAPSARAAASAYTSPRSLCRTGPFVELDAEPGEIVEDRLLPTLDGSRRIGVVDPQHHDAAVRVREAAVRDRGQRVAEVERAGRARSEADADRMFYASIGTWPGCAATRSSHARIAGYGSRSKPPSCATCVYA